MPPIFERERLRPTTTPTQVVGLPGRPIDRPTPVRAPDPQAPTMQERPRPAATGSNDLQQLAIALSGSSTVINAFAQDYFKGVRQEEAQTADADATALSLRSQVSTWGDAVRENPDLADRSPFYRGIFEERLARQSIQRRGNALHGEYWNSELAGSADPAAIQGWLSGRMRDTLDQYKDSPAQRAAAAEEVRNQAAGLVRTHQANAVRNLVNQNEDSLSQSVGAVFDTYHLRTGGSAVTGDANFSMPDDLRRIYEKVGREEGIPPILLAAQGHRESGFRPEVINGTRRSSAGAIGIAQVLPSTARAPGFGVAPISEQDLLDPEKAIRFQAQYLKARGRELGVSDWSDPRQAARGLAAYGGPGEEARGYSAGILAMASNARGAASTGPGSTGPAPVMAELQRLEAEARAQGIDGRRINQILTQATAQAMVRTGRLDLATLGDMPRPDGTPGFGTTAEARAQFESAKAMVLSRQVQEDNQAELRHQRARKEMGETISRSIALTLVEQLTNGQEPRLTADQLRIAARHDPQLVAAVTGLQSSLRGVAQTEDTRTVAEVELRVNTGEASVQDVTAAIGTTLRDPTTIRRLLAKAVENTSAGSENNVFKNPVVTQIIRETQEAAAGMEGNGVLKNYGIGISVGNAMRETAARFMEENPRATQLQLVEHLRKQQMTMVPNFNRDVNLPGYDARARNPSAPDPRDPDPNATRAAVQPNPSVRWQRIPVFANEADLDKSFEAWRRNPEATSGPGVLIAQWVTTGGIQDVARFYDAQKKLLSQGGGTNRR